MDSSEKAPLPATEDGRCPRCGAVPTPVAYGYPSPEMFEAAERGEILLGGCVIFDGQPSSRCSACGADIECRAWVTGRGRPFTGC